MGFQKRLKLMGLFAAAIPLVVAVIVALYPVPSAHALKAAAPEINYDDPNMATTEGYVAEASISCIKQGGSGTDVHSCMRGYSKPADESVAVAQKKDEAEAPSSSEISKDKN